jgi:hypothetical protein
MSGEHFAPKHGDGIFRLARRPDQLPALGDVQRSRLKFLDDELSHSSRFMNGVAFVDQ